MEERGNKTIICSVFFLDIVEYSKKSVSGQISLKERFNAFLSTAIRDVPINDRIILDTGDGAAISFLGDVEDALRAALSMRSSLLSEDGLKDPPLLVRMGVNLGPVRLVKDINGQPNIVGDGINVAQRVMGFAAPGQILVSRSYYDAASRLSQEYAGMFHFEGSRTDKHVREHEVYAIGHPGELASAQQAGQKSATRLSAAWGEFRAKSKAHWDALLVKHNELAAYVRETFNQASGKQKALYAGLVTVPFLLILLLVVKLAHKQEAPPNVLPKNAEVSAPAKVAGTQSGVQVATAAPVAATGAAKSVVPASELKTKAQSKKEAQKKTAEKKEAAKKETSKKDKKDHKGKATGQASGEPGVLALTIKPWGEVYLDGKMQGVSPPVTKLQVSAGEHVIEIRNTTFPAYKQSIKIKAGDKTSINYKFAN
ncbi:MAG: adenylate/guanylate cyclase domain-containing protein [Gallionellaceae bacterium]|nr:MAG: adenylate/guanylate cyclase domain-containing protein [Gallionellaceae bacterium]